MVRAFEPPVYCYHEIVHNQRVVDRFRDLGVVFVDDIDEVPAGPAGHAERPRLGPRGRGRGPGPRRLRRRRGVPARHQGAPRGQGPGRQGLPDRLRRPRGPRGGRRHDGRGPRLDPPGRERRRRRRPPRVRPSRSPCSPRPRSATATGRACSTPPTSASPRCGCPGRSDLCFATTNRQSALMEIATRCDAVVVIGSANSSNTRALESLARDAGCARVFRVNGVEELPDDLLGTVGVTAGASAPEELVEAVIAHLRPDRRRGRGRLHRRGRVLPAAPQPPRPARRPRHLRHLQPRRAGRPTGRR